MIEIIEFNSMIPRELSDKVKLEPYNEKGTVKLFGSLTHEVAQEHYLSMCRIDSYLKPEDYYRDKRNIDISYKMVEHLAKIGALAVNINKDKGHIYELGCGIAIPSITCTKLSDYYITLIDQDEQQIDGARMLANKFGTDLEFIIGTVKDVIPKRSLKSQDVLILTEPGNILLIDYVKGLLKKYEVTLVLSLRFERFENPKMRDEAEKNLKDFINHTFNEINYKVTVGLSNFSDQYHFVFVASK